MSRNRIISRMRKQAHVLSDLKSVVANCFLNCLSELLNAATVANYIKRNNLSMKKFEQSKNYQEMVLTNCFVEEGGIGMILEDLNAEHPELSLEWDNETNEVVEEIIEEYSEHAIKDISTVMSDVIYDVVEAA